MLLLKLPSLIWWGVRVKILEESKCEITIPYNWRTTNPFNSMYFAAQAGAAEFSTGMLVQLAIQGRGKWSMYVTGFRAEYGVTAKTKTTFICSEGDKVNQMIQEIEASGNPQSLEMISIGYNTQGQEVSRFYITWSLKKK